jgi:hypothetical protein
LTGSTQALPRNRNRAQGTWTGYMDRAHGQEQGCTPHAHRAVRLGSRTTCWVGQEGT